MKVYREFDSIGKIKNPVLTIGTFDGVHIGHQKIIQKINDIAHQIGGESVLFTFSPHPRTILNPDKHGLKLIQTEAEKIAKLERMGLDHLIVYPFTKAFSNTKASDFVADFLVDKLHVHHIVVGYDHQFGKNREGSLEHLQEMSKTLAFQVLEIPAQDIDEVNVSSTKIREAIESGNMELANTYLMERFTLSGKVIHGKSLGNKIGFPTANFLIEDPLKIIPKSGVYAVEVLLESGERKGGMMNIGIRPTVDNDFNNKMEVHIFDFEEDLYGQEISVSLFKRMRDEIQFDSLESLINQLQKDEQNIRSFLYPTHITY